MSELEDFRAEKDEFFRNQPQSPLTHKQRATFGGLAYYPGNGALVVREALATDGVDLEEEIVMQTTTGGTQTYRRAGVVRFDVDGVTAQVTLFASADSDELFLPFRDATNGHETYGRALPRGGPGLDQVVVVDLNYAYNPGAYNRLSCPISPGENWLAVPIRAGEKSFPDAYEVAIA
jgi:uncharacterized protein (DUF1684 family)